MAPGARTDEVVYEGSATAVDDADFDDFYFVIRDPANSYTYLELDIGDQSDEPGKRHIDLTAIDFLADSDGDGVTDYQEVMMLTDPEDPSDAPPTPRVRLSVYHSQSVESDFGGDAAAGILHYLETTNHIYSTSGIDIELELESVIPVALDESQSLSATLDDMGSARGAFIDIDDVRISSLSDLAFAFKARAEADISLRTRLPEWCWHLGRHGLK